MSHPDDTTTDSVLGPLPRGESALARAVALTEQAATVGFDWPRIDNVLDKVEEEVRELREDVAAGRREAARAELGDVLFALANVARFLEVSPDEALDGTNERFVARFRFIEARLRDAGERAEDVDLARLDGLWNDAKRAGVGVAGSTDDAPGEGDRNSNR